MNKKNFKITTKALYVSVSLLAIFASCDVRRHDVLAPPDRLKQQQEIKDPTTVQIIDSAFDFGTIAEGESVNYNYRFKNTGTKPLIISNVGASCGCTVPEKPTEPIMPGDTAVIKVKFNSEGHPGKAHKIVNVSSNADPAFPELQLTGDVTPKKEN